MVIYNKYTRITCRKEQSMNKELRNFRLSQNKSMEDISSEMGISKSFYEKVEYGQRTPSYGFIKRFKRQYPHCDTDKIFFSNNYT